MAELSGVKKEKEKVAGVVRGRKYIQGFGGWWSRWSKSKTEGARGNSGDGEGNR